MVGCQEWTITADGEAWEEHETDCDKFLFQLLTTGLSEIVTTSILSSSVLLSKLASKMEYFWPLSKIYLQHPVIQCSSYSTVMDDALDV